MDIRPHTTAGELADRYGCSLIGKRDTPVSGLNEIHKVRKGDITFCDAKKYYIPTLKSAASVIILDQELEDYHSKTVLIHPDPWSVYQEISLFYHPRKHFTSQVSDTAHIHPSAVIQANCVIGPHVIIGAESFIGSGTHIDAYTEIGNQVHIKPGCVIGTEAFYFQKREGQYEPWHSVGRVVIEDNVWIGARCTIDRGVSGDTHIMSGTRIDNSVHLAHGVVIGHDCMIMSQVGIAGKTILGDRVVLYGQVGVIQNLTIGDDVVVLAQSGVGKNLAPGKVYFGSPCREARDKYREMAWLRMQSKK